MPQKKPKNPINQMAKDGKALVKNANKAFQPKRRKK